MISGSPSTSSEGAGGAISLNNAYPNKISYVIDHQIYINSNTLIGDLLKIEIRNFETCTKCGWKDISVINLGNIAIQMKDFLNSYQNKSIEGILNYFYKENNFGKENIKSNQ